MPENYWYRVKVLSAFWENPPPVVNVSLMHSIVLSPHVILGIRHTGNYTTPPQVCDVSILLSSLDKFQVLITPLYSLTSTLLTLVGLFSQICIQVTMIIFYANSIYSEVTIALIYPF